MCTTYVNNKRDQRAQRYKMTLTTKIDVPGGYSITRQISAEFASEANMTYYTDKWSQLTNVPVTQEIKVAG